MKVILSALKKTFAAPRAWIEALAVSAAVFAILILVPVYTTPGDDVAFQWHITPWNVVVLMGALSVLNGLLFAMHFEARRNGGAKKAIGARQATTVVGILGASLVSTLACAACYSSVLAVFGLGGTAFLVTNKWWFAALAIGLTLFAMHATSKKVLGICAEACNR